MAKEVTLSMDLEALNTYRLELFSKNASAIQEVSNIPHSNQITF